MKKTLHARGRAHTPPILPDRLADHWRIPKLAEDDEYRTRAEAHRERVRGTSYKPHPVNRRGGGA